MVTDQLIVGDAVLDLIAAETSLTFEHRRFGWLLSYHRPIRVDTGRNSIPIRDHVMLARVAIAVVMMFLTIRRSTSE
jgi:hypothetical protein